MLELEPLPEGEENLLGPTDKLMIVKSNRTIAHQEGWTRLCIDTDPDEEQVLQLRGIGLKMAHHLLRETNVYGMYPPIAPSSLPMLDTVVKEDFRSIVSWETLVAEYDPLARDDKYFGESFCNRGTEQDVQSTKVRSLSQLITHPLRLTLEATSHILTTWMKHLFMNFGRKKACLPLTPTQAKNHIPF